MNGAHWHLLFNHFPIMGSFFSCALLTGGYLFKNQAIKQSALGLIILTGLLSIPALLTGESAEDVLKAIGKKNPAMIHPHEEAAELAFWIMEITAIFGIIAFVLNHKNVKAGKNVTAATFILLVICVALFINVNYLGGKIRHTEIRDTTSVPLPESELETE